MVTAVNCFLERKRILKRYLLFPRSQGASKVEQAISHMKEFRPSAETSVLGSGFS